MGSSGNAIGLSSFSKLLIFAGSKHFKMFFFHSNGLHWSRSCAFEHYTAIGFQDNGNNILTESWTIHVGENGDQYELFLGGTGGFRRTINRRDISQIHVSFFIGIRSSIYSIFLQGPLD